MTLYISCFRNYHILNAESSANYKTWLSQSHKFMFNS